LLQRLIGDKAYDSDALDEQMSEYGIEMISPNRTSRKQRTQDGHRLLRGYRALGELLTARTLPSGLAFRRVGLEGAWISAAAW
jgi:hypothetical protein